MSTKVILALAMTLVSIGIVGAIEPVYLGELQKPPMINLSGPDGESMFQNLPHGIEYLNSGVPILAGFGMGSGGILPIMGTKIWMD